MHTTLDAGSAAITKTPFDVCVFGTGPAGLPVALDLAKAGKRVALIEAGGFEYSEESQNYYRGTETGLNTWNALERKRMRFFGGTTAAWAGRCALYDEIDFAADTYHGMPGWPITRKALLDHVAQATDILDVRWENLAPQPFRNFPDSRFVHSSEGISPPTRFAEKYRREVVESPNILLVTMANLVELRLLAPSGSKGSLDHAVLKDYRGQTFKIKARRYVLALGSIENARLLLNSDKQVAGGIGNHAGYVGRCFMEHLDIQIGRFVVLNKDYFIPEKIMGIAPVPSVLQSQRVGNGVLAVDPTHVPIDYGRLRDVKRVLREGACRFELVREFTRKFKDFNCLGEGVITSEIEQCPNPDSRVSLTNDIDPLGLRRVNLHWVINESDRRTIRALGMELAKEWARLDVARVQLSDFIVDQSKPILPVGAHAHHMGTTRMSRDPRHGVVDANCRVHGVDNLYVSGGSVFPTGGGINPTFTIVLLALRLSKHLAQLS